MITAEEMEPAGHVHVNAGRLWAGGVATALVAALAVLAGVLITRGVLGIPVLAPKAASDFGDSSTAVYAGLAAGCALLATALLHVLLLGTPRPFMFFAWITGLADVVAAAAPFTQPAPLASKIFTAIINIVVGVAVISLLSGVGRVAIRRLAAATPDHSNMAAAADHARGLIHQDGALLEQVVGRYTTARARATALEEAGRAQAGQGSQDSAGGPAQPGLRAV